MFSFTLLKKSFIEQKMEGKRETKVDVQPKGFLKSYKYYFFNIKEACLFSWTTDLKHLRSINIHFKRFFQVLQSPISPGAPMFTMKLR
jgi:hypothetical protein